MTEFGINCFEKFIKHGYNHIDFDSLVVQKIEHDLTYHLRKVPSWAGIPLEQKKLKWLVKDCAFLSIIIQGFAINNLRLKPYRGSLVVTKSDTKGTLFKIERKPRLNWNWYDADVDFAITFLRQIQDKWRKEHPGFTEFSIRVNKQKVEIPRSSNDKLLSSILSILEEHKQDKRQFRVKQRREYKSFFFKMIDLTVNHYVQELFGSEISESAIASLCAIVLMLAGYLDTENEYEKNKLIKDYRISVDHEFKKRTNKKRLIRKARYYTYYEAIRNKFNSIKEKSTMSLVGFYSIYY